MGKQKTSLCQKLLHTNRNRHHSTQVEFEFSEDPKDPSKRIAVNVTGPDGTDCKSKTKGSGKGKGKGIGINL